MREGTERVCLTPDRIERAAGDLVLGLERPRIFRKLSLVSATMSRAKLWDAIQYPQCTRIENAGRVITMPTTATANTPASSEFNRTPHSIILPSRTKQHQEATPPSTPHMHPFPFSLFNNAQQTKKAVAELGYKHVILLFRGPRC